MEETLNCFEITVNGETRQVRPDLTVAELLRELGIAAERVAVELDRRIVSKRDWDGRKIDRGAQVEIVQFVGGG